MGSPLLATLAAFDTREGLPEGEGEHSFIHKDNFRDMMEGRFSLGLPALSHPHGPQPALTPTAACWCLAEGPSVTLTSGFCIEAACALWESRANHLFFGKVLCCRRGTCIRLGQAGVRHRGQRASLGQDEGARQSWAWQSDTPVPRPPHLSGLELPDAPNTSSTPAFPCSLQPLPCVRWKKHFPFLRLWTRHLRKGTREIRSGYCLSASESPGPLAKF